MNILKKVDLSEQDEQAVIDYCKENEDQLSHTKVINLVEELKTGGNEREEKDGFYMSKHEAYRWWYAFRKKHALKITAKLK